MQLKNSLSLNQFKKEMPSKIYFGVKDQDCFLIQFKFKMIKLIK